MSPSATIIWQTPMDKSTLVGALASSRRLKPHESRTKESHFKKAGLCLGG